MPPGVVTNPLFRVPDGGAPIRGTKAVYEFNNLVINDRLTPDTYRLQETTGMGGADIRDARDPIPGDHGEFAYDSFYGGRTMTMTGALEAGNEFMLDQMDQDMRSALGYLVEAPLKARWYDVFDSFSDPNALLYFTTDAGAGVGSATFTVSGGLLVPATASANLAIYRSAEQRSYVDVQLTKKINLGALGSTFGLIFKRQSTGNYLSAQLVNGVGVKFVATQAGTPTPLTSVGTQSALSAGNQTVWMRVRITDNQLIGEIWNQDPFTNPPATARIAQSTYQLQGALADTFGGGIGGNVGLLVNSPSDQAWSIDDFRIESIYPGDAVRYCKAIEEPTIKNARGTATTYKRAFQLSLRASNPRWTNPVLLSQSAIPQATPALGRFYPRTYPLVYTTALSSSGLPLSVQASNQIIAINKGNFEAQAIIQFFGGQTNPTIANLTNGLVLALNGVIADGDIITVDAATKSVVNAAGTDQAGMVSLPIGWMLLDPGINILVASAQGFDASASTAVNWRHSWK